MIKAKNMFLLVLTIVFALTLSGTVFAEDVGGDSEGTLYLNNNSVESSSSLNELEITGQVRDCVTGEPFSGVDVTASYNGSQLETTQTVIKEHIYCIFSAILPSSMLLLVILA